MHNRSYNEQDAIQRLLLFEEGLSRLIELMKIEKKDVLGNDMDFLCQSIMQDVCRKCPKSLFAVTICFPAFIASIK